MLAQRLLRCMASEARTSEPSSFPAATAALSKMWPSACRCHSLFEASALTSVRPVLGLRGLDPWRMITCCQYPDLLTRGRQTPAFINRKEPELGLGQLLFQLNLLSMFLWMFFLLVGHQNYLPPALRRISRCGTQTNPKSCSASRCPT